MNKARCEAYTPASLSSVSYASRMFAEVCFMSFFEGAARIEFVDVEAMYLCRLSSKLISYAIISWSVSFGVLYDDTRKVESRCFL